MEEKQKKTLSIDRKFSLRSSGGCDIHSLVMETPVVVCVCVCV